MRNIEVESGEVKIKIGETELSLSMEECVFLLQKLKSVFPRESLIEAEIAAGKREFKGPATGVALPGGWSLPAAIDPNAVFANAVVPPKPEPPSTISMIKGSDPTVLPEFRGMTPKETALSAGIYDGGFSH